MYIPTITAPCHFSIVNFLPINIIMNKMALEITVMKISILELELNGKGLIIELIPSIQNMLKILEPTTFPIAMSACFLYAAIADVANSGREVPIAIIVKPIND
jgi:hypothetical protein